MPLNLVRRNANHNVCKVWSEAAPRKAQEAARRQSMAEEFLQLVHRGARFDKRSVKADDKLFKPHATEIKSDSSDTAFKDNLDFFDCDATGGDHIGQAESERDNTPALKKKTVDEPRKGKDSIQRKEKESTQKTKSFALGDRNEVNSIRRKYGLHVQGTDVADPILQFSEMLRLGVPEWMLKNLTRDKPEGCGFTDPTSIQKQAIPILLSGRDLLACAPTGSGKTAAFSVPILSSLKAPKNVGLRALILSPTRELAEQIFRHFKLLSKRKKFKMFMLSKSNANSSMWGREGSKRRDLLVATPMRLVHLLRNHALDLSGVQWLFLDEADRLFEMGFLDQVDEILAACTYPKLQRAMFSATMPQGVETLARTVLRDPIRVTVGHRNAAAHSVKQRLLFVGKEQGKLIAFRQLVQEGLNLPVLVFVQSKDRGEQLFRELVYDGLHVDVIHSQRTRLQRENIIKQFRAGELWVLICTDLMARGIDFAGVNCVVNYDFPQSVVSYIHRIGRTGRAGREGEAITFFTESDKPMLKGVARVIKHAGGDVPAWMLGIHSASKKLREHIAKVPPSREPISTELDELKRMEEYRQEKRKLKRKKVAQKKKKLGGGEEGEMEQEQEQEQEDVEEYEEENEQEEERKAANMQDEVRPAKKKASSNRRKKEEEVESTKKKSKRRKKKAAPAS